MIEGARRSVLLALCILLAVVPAAAGAQEASPPPSAEVPVAPTPVPAPEIAARASLMVDLDSGRVLYARNEHQQMPVASLTKVMTALVARDRYDLDETVTVTDEVLSTKGGRAGLEPGMRLTVRDLLLLLLLVSANDAGTVLATHDPLGSPSFIEAMNAKARAIGARSSVYRNPHGMDEPGHLSTAWDQALLTQHMLKDPVLSDMVATKTTKITWPDGSERTLRNHHKLLGSVDGVAGVKTGFTNGAGRCLITAANLPSGKVITIVLNADQHYAMTRTLLEYAATMPAGTELILATPRPLVLLDRPVIAASVAPAPVRLRWVVFPMAMLALAMVLTLRRSPRGRMAPAHIAAEFHGFLDPFVTHDARK